MVVTGNLLNRQSLLFSTSHLSDLVGCSIRSCSHMDGDAARQIGEVKSLLTVTAVRGTDQLKEHVVFGNRKWLAFAKHPSDWRKVAGKHSYFSYIRFWHSFSPFSFAMGRCPGER